MYRDDFFSSFPPPSPSFNHYEESRQSKLMVEVHTPACADSSSETPNLSCGHCLGPGPLPDLECRDTLHPGLQLGPQ